MNKFKHFLYMAVMLLVGITMGACSEDETEPNEEPVKKNPSILVTAGSVTENSISFTVTPTDAEEVRFAYYEKTEGFTAPAYIDVLAEGTAIDNKAASNQKVENLNSGTTYVVIAVAAGNELVAGQTIEMTTSEEPVTVAVALEAGEVKPLSFEFTATPTDATKLHWAAYEKGTPAPVIEEVLENENVLEANKANTVLVREVKPATTYVVVAVAADAKHTVYEELEITTAEANLTFDAAYKLADKSSGDFNPYLQFACEDYVLEVDFYHLDNPGAYLPAGTYTYSTEGDSGVFSNYSVIKYKENGNTLDAPKLRFSAGTITVTITEKSYKFDFDLTLAADGDEIGGAVKATYEGLVNGMEVVDDQPGPGNDTEKRPELPADVVMAPDMTDAAWVLYNSKSVSLSFMDNASNPRVVFTSDLVVPQDKALEPGLYSVENGKMLSTSWMDSFDYYTIDEGDVVEGSWTYVAKDAAGVYTIEMLFMNADGDSIYTKYVGSTITEMPTETGGGGGEEVEIYPEYATAQIFGGKEVYLKFYESKSMNDFELVIDLYTESGITTLPEGEYFFGSDEVAGELNDYSTYCGYNENAPYYTKGNTMKFEDGMVSVEYADDAWMIFFDITLTDGTYLTGGFNGQIDGLTAPETGDNGGNGGEDNGFNTYETSFTTASFDNADMGVGRIILKDATSANNVEIGFMLDGDNYEGTYSTEDDTMVLAYTKNMGYDTKLDYNGDNATAGTMTLTKDEAGWKVEFDLEFDMGDAEWNYNLTGSYVGKITGMGSGGAAEEVTNLTFANADPEDVNNLTCVVYTRDQNDGDQYTTGLFTAEMSGFNELNISFYPTDKSDLSGTYTTADETILISCPWGTYSRLDSKALSDVTCTLTAQGNDIYTLDATFKVGENSYTATCSNLKCVTPTAPEAGGMSR